MPAGIPDNGVLVEVNGELTLQTDPQVQADFPGATITPTQDFAFGWNGVLVQFRSNDTSQVPADLLAALTAAGAPFTTP